ncbi:TPA: hypothetical protein IUX95_002278, partial [Enterococcus faecalis OG1RF]|nr:hypothetical protein [Enterococcus faecalis OG1RF]HDT8116145.1 hypothetical protein [Enterococcus faecalis]
SLLTVNNSVWTTLILIIIICGSYSLNSLCHVKYQFLIQASDSFTIYLLVQSWTLSIILGIQSDGKPLFGSFYILISVCYLIIVGILNFLRCKIMVLEYLRQKNINVEISKKTIFFNSLILKLSTLMIVLIVTGIQFYRLNKSWLSQSTNETGLLVIENKWLGTAIFLIIIAIIFLIVLVFSLLPTMIFNKKIFVEGIVLKKFSEEFRQEYGFTKQEWYGEDS